MNRKIKRVIAVLSFVGLAPLPLRAAPKPNPVGENWEIELEYQDIQRIDLNVPGDPHPATYWYMIYTVTNNSGKDVPFYPSFTLVTDTFEAIEANEGVSAVAFDAIKQRHQRLYPFMVPPMQAMGRLLQGEDNARTSVVIFKAFDREADHVDIYVGGLSGQFAKVPNHNFDPAKPESLDNPPSFTLRKTLVIPYNFPGDSETQKWATPVRGKHRWVMR